MAVKTHLCEDDFRGILDNYDIGAFVSASPISQGTVQTNYMLRTTEKKVVLRRYENRSPGSVLFELDVLRLLKDNRYPCPGVYPGKEKLHLHMGKPYALFEFMEGEHVQSPNRRQFAELVRHVARLNAITENYASAYAGERLNYSVSACREMASRIAREAGSGDAMDKLKWYLCALGALDLPGGLPMGVCHCDFHYTNVLYKGDALSGVIDFDDANHTFLLYDLACLFSPFRLDFTWQTWPSFAAGDDVFDFAGARETVAEYAKTRPLSETEKDHLFDVYKLTIFVDCLWYFKRGHPADFYEKRKIERLDRLGRAAFRDRIFAR